jgi:DNA-binding GntR family transcriptional regulator
MDIDKQIQSLRKPDSLRGQIVDFMREAISSGRFQPGEKLVERELCEMLDISRTSLREALRQLEAEKLITTKLHRGPTVATISRAEAMDLYAIRALLESYAVREFTQKASDEEVKRLGIQVGNLHATAKSGDREKLLAAKADFYDVILAGCGNQLVSEMLLGMLSRINLLRSTSLTQPARLQASLKEIDQLFALIEKRDAAAAHEASRLHVFSAQQAALTVLEQQEASLSTPTSKER